MNLPIKISRNLNSNGKLSREFTFLLKCICCLIVGLHHFSRIQVERFGSSNPVYILLALQGGNIGVGLFFFFSGYGLMESAKLRTLSVREVILKRFWRLFWPILIINTLFIVFSSLYVKGKLDFSDISPIYLVDFKRIDPVLWFIEVLFTCYSVFYISLSIKNIKVRNCVMYGAGVALVIFYVLTRRELYWHYTNIPMFFLGIAYSQLCERVSPYLNWKVSVLLVGIFGILTVCGWLIVHTVWAKLGLCIGILVVLLTFARYYSLKISNFEKIHDSTYEYYLTHNKILILFMGGVMCIYF